MTDAPPGSRFPGSSVAGLRHAVVLTAVAAVLLAYVTTHLPTRDGSHPAGLIGAALAAVAVIAVGTAFRWPVTAVLLAAGAVSVYVARNYPDGPILAAGLLTAFVVGWRSDRHRAALAAVTIGGAVLIGALVNSHRTDIGWFYLGWTVAGTALGDALRSRREVRAEQLERRRSAEQGREAETSRRLAEQRLSIARDLHDGVAHAMATINVQAAAAARVIDRKPQAAKHALTAIARASGTVLDDLNAVVALLRSEDEAADTAPQPGLSEVSALVDAASTDRLQCRLVVSGDTSLVADAIGVAAYRIVQESLTNALRHSGGRHVNIAVTVDGARLTIEVEDDGSGTATSSPGGGIGITGMRERARATGGTLEAGRTPNGFRVSARWPSATTTRVPA